jgi:predicted RNase H-like HicB family nuclease
MLQYATLAENDYDGTVLVTFPDFDCAPTCGDTREEALVRDVDALETIIRSRVKHKSDIPDALPTDVGVPGTGSDLSSA